LRKLYEELEFRTLASRLGRPDMQDFPAAVTTEITVFTPQQSVQQAQGTLFGETESNNETAAATAGVTPHNYSIAETVDQAETLARTLSRLNEFCFDTETTSLDPLNADLVAVTFSWEKGSGTMLWLPADRNETLKLLKPFRTVFEN
jgi:DNA polymerase-1